MRRSAIAASLLLTASMPALAQNLEALRDGLAHLPASVLTQKHGDIAYFIDVKAIAALAADNSEVRPFFRTMIGTDINALRSLAQTEPAEWEANAGTSLDKLRYFTGYGFSPNLVSFWGLTGETAATDQIEALKARGFKTAGAPGVVGNGEPMHYDPEKMDPSDPWRSSVGGAQFAAASGNNVVQTQAPMDAAVAAARQPRLGENPIVMTALAGLESAGDGEIVQAVVISPIFGLGGIDPASVLSPSASIEETRKQIEAQMAALGKGIPPYLGGIVADMQSDMQGVAISLAYPDCAIAQKAADALAQRWVEMAGEAAQGEVETDIAEGADGLCAAVFDVMIETVDPEQNPAYRAVIEPYMRRVPGVLQIGES